MAGRVLKARKLSAAQFVSRFVSTIQDYDFPIGSLVLVHNSHVEKELNRKTKPHYLGPMVVICCTTRGTYILSELDGAVSRLCYAAFRIVPYFPRSVDNIPMDSLLSATDLEDITHCSEDYPLVDDPSDPSGY